MPEPEPPRVQPAADAGYAERRCCGFTVRLSLRWFDPQSERCRSAYRRLEDQLKTAVFAIPPRPLAALTAVPIIVEWDRSDLGAASTRTSGAALYLSRAFASEPEPEFAARSGAVVVFAASCLIDDAMAGYAPGWLVHELAHAYHERVLSNDDEQVTAAYRAAVDGGLYDELRDATGRALVRPRPAYAMKNEYEYFAQLTETYLVRGWEFPYSVTDLQRYDPRGYRLMASRWGDIRQIRKRSWTAAAMALAVAGPLPR